MPAVAVEQALREIYESRGRLDPKDVVEVARNPKSVLHDTFNWNNDEAAEQWRLQQARQLIRSVKIERVENTEGPRSVRFVRQYVHDPENDGYLATEDVAKLPDVRERVLDEMRRDLLRLQSKWDLYKETFESLAVEILLATDSETQEPTTTGS
jgi:hypothetical protein